MSTVKTVETGWDCILCPSLSLRNSIKMRNSGVVRPEDTNLQIYKTTETDLHRERKSMLKL